MASKQEYIELIVPEDDPQDSELSDDIDLDDAGDPELLQLITETWGLDRIIYDILTAHGYNVEYSKILHEKALNDVFSDTKWTAYKHALRQKLMVWEESVLHQETEAARSSIFLNPANQHTMGTNEASASDCYVWGGNTGTHGLKYENDLAFGLFIRASLQQPEFKLATEMKHAGKFDDTVMIFPETKEMWFFQAKHSQISSHISFQDLFPEWSKGNTDFSLPKYMHSYLCVTLNDEFKEYQNKLFFLFTNKSLDTNNEQLKELMNIKTSEVNNIIKFEESDQCYIRFEPKPGKIDSLLKLINVELTEIKDAIIKLFKDGIISNILPKYRTPLQKILAVEEEYLKFSDLFLTTRDSTQEWIFGQLQQHFKDMNKVKTMKKEAMKSFLQGKSKDEVLPTLLDENSAIKFFQHFTFCVKQPSDRLRTIAEEDLRKWMRGWIPPDDLGKFDQVLLKHPMTEFGNVFENWKKHMTDEIINAETEPTTGVKKEKPMAKYLLFSDGHICVEKIREVLNKHVTQRILDYINRQLIVNDSIISDDSFVTRLLDDKEEQKFFLFIGEPGMGKTTLFQHTAFQVQKKSNVDIFLIYLNTLDKHFEKMGDCEKLDAVYSILNAALSDISLKILKNNIDNNSENNENRTIVMFDGFDETAFPKQAIAIFSHLLSTNKVQVVVSGRYHVKDMLEETFKFKAIRLVPFKNDKQVLFLSNAWNAHDLAPEDFKIYSTKLLEKFNSDIQCNQYNFFGLPIMLRLLAEVYADHFKEFSKSDKENRKQYDFPSQKLSVVLLFEQFIQRSFLIKLKKKDGKDAYQEVQPSNDKEMKCLFDRFTIEHQMVACEQLDIEELMEIITRNENKTVYTDLMSRLQDGTEKSPLFNFSNGSLKFVHLSYAEFFVAKFLYDQIENCKDILIQTLDDHETVRRFFFMLVEEKFSERSRQMVVLNELCKTKSVVAFWACEASCVTLVTQLIHKHTSFKTLVHEDYGTLLLAATQAECKSLVSILLDYGISANIPKLSPLHVATENGNLDIAELLLDRSANVNLQDDENRTPLHIAIDKGHLELVKLLVERNANLNLKDDFGRAPLHSAISKMRSVTRNVTSLHITINKGPQEIVKILLDGFANVNLPDAEKRTPLHLAIDKGNQETVKLLLDRKANVDLRDALGRTPHDLAIIKGQTQIAKLLQDPSQNSEN